jgi:hypothetical protein
MKTVSDEFIGICIIFVIIALVGGLNILWMVETGDPLSDTSKRAYERVHKGEIKCVDTPDGTVYCYKAKEEK